MFVSRSCSAYSSKGFTLIELMIVIAIIAVLAAIIIPNFVKSRQTANLAACEENEKNIAVACELYANANDGFYPTSLSKLTPDYLQSLPTCPAGDNPNRSNSTYGYAFRANPGGYIL